MSLKQASGWLRDMLFVEDGERESGDLDDGPITHSGECKMS